MVADRYDKRVIRLTEMVDIDGVLADHEFVGCVIQGPAVVALQDSSVINCNLGGPDFDAVLWEVPLTRSRVVGVVALIRCTFSECRFENVGFAGPPEFVERMRS